MSTWSRRAFVTTVGIGGAAATARLVTARGHEALREAWAASTTTAAQAAPSATIELDSNENPNGPGARSLAAIRDALSLANRYPYVQAGTLTTAIARAHDLRTSQIILGCGSSEILRMAMQTFASRARHLVAAAPTYELPGDYALSFSVPLQSVRVDASLKPNLAAMEMSAQRAGVVYLCNPGNPTGTVLSARAISGFVERVSQSSPRTAIVIDEAYHDYVDDPSYRTSIPLAVTHRNVIVARTFSKIHGLAGLRCGYAVAHPETISELSRYKLQTGVNQLAIAAARAAIADKERVERERALNRDAREYTRKLFESIGYATGPSETNFMLVDLRRDAQPFRDGCRRAGVAVGRAFPPLNNHVRISIGTMDEMQRAGSVFRKLLG
jgi:histidinol-phosphate aminotransferase